ncbi:MAG: DNA-protecting protein DprA [Desulfuromonadales bacterium]|nr:DNA-protecting protein DprA [Desulfuromonadales bacterium]
MTAEETGWLRLQLTPGLGRRRLLRLLEAFGSAEAILAANPDAWRRRAGLEPALAMQVPNASDPQLEQARGDLERLGAVLVPFTDPAFPPLLRTIPDPPALLYRRGELPTGEALAVVGSRRASETGRRLTFDLCTELAGREIVVVSGLARGIDTCAHRGALEGGGRSIGVLGCGIDQIYPPENAPLFDRLLESGAIISEYPPGTPPLPGHFPGRNRIISGLCRGVLIVEAAAGSGSLITAEFALEQGREVFAVPGAVSSPVSGGVNQLLKDGAHLVTTAADILSVLWPQTRPRQVRQQEEVFAQTLAGNDRHLYLCLEETPLHIDHLVRKSGLTPMEVSVILLHLELQGGVEVLPGQRFTRGRRS